MSKIIRLKHTDSTNKYAKILLAQEDVEHETIIVADHQTDGIGRLGKSWFSYPGKGLYCSIIIKPSLEREKLSFLTLLTGLVVAEKLEDFLALSVGVKWPNDIMIAGRKCGGILCEAVFSDSDTDYVIIGIGLNVNVSSSDVPDDLKGKLTSFYLETGKTFKPDDVLKLITGHLFQYLEKFEKEGFVQFLEPWRKRDFLQGKQASWCSINREMVIGCAEGLADSGEYYIRDQDGKLHQILSGDVSLVNK